MVSIGAISGARACRILGEIQSGPGALDVSRFSRSFLMPACSILMSGMEGALFSGSLHLEFMSESVYCLPSLNAELNCLFSTCAFSLEFVTSKPLSLRGGDTNIGGFLLFYIAPKSFIFLM